MSCFYRHLFWHCCFVGCSVIRRCSVGCFSAIIADFCARVGHVGARRSEGDSPLCSSADSTSCCFFWGTGIFAYVSWNFTLIRIFLCLMNVYGTFLINCGSSRQVRKSVEPFCILTAFMAKIDIHEVAGRFVNMWQKIFVWFLLCLLVSREGRSDLLALGWVCLPFCILTL